jgi:hypothetical protein
LNKGTSKFAPIDVIAILTILVSAGLLLMGVDGVMKGVFASVAGYYFIGRVPKQLAVRRTEAKRLAAGSDDS